MKKNVLIALLLTCVLIGGSGLAREKVFSVSRANYKFEITPDKIISLESFNADFKDLLVDVVKILNIQLEIKGERKVRTSLKIKDVHVEEAIRQIIKDVSGSYVMVYGGHNHKLRKVNIYWKSGRIIPLSTQKDKKSPKASIAEVQPSISTEEIVIDEEHKQVTIRSSPNNPDKDSVQNYIIQRHALVDHLMVEQPDLVLESEVSFTDFLSLKEVRELIGEDKTVDVKILRYGSERFSRAYPLPESNLNDKVQETVLNNYNETIQGLQDKIKEGGENDPNKNELKSFYEMSKDQKDFVQTEGLQIYGLTVFGKPKAIGRIKNDSRVRLVDPRWDERVKSYQQKGYKVDVVTFSIPPMF